MKQRSKSKMYPPRATPVKENRLATSCTETLLSPSRLAGRRLQQAKSQGISLRAIARELDMSRVTVRKYAKAESPPTKLHSAKERTKAEALAASSVAAD